MSRGPVPVAVVTAALGLLVAVPGARAAPAPERVTCAEHVEPSAADFDPATDVIREPLALTIRGDLRDLERASFPRRRGRLHAAKLPAGVRAGAPVTLRVHRRDRRHAAFAYSPETRNARRIADADRALVFEPCPPDTPAFSDGGTVGPVTGWAGTLVFTQERCVTLEVLAEGRPRRTIRLGLGRRCR